MVECANPASQPRPGEPYTGHEREPLPYSAGEQAQFLSRAVRFDTFTVQDFIREFGVLDVSCAEPVPWWVRVYGFNIAEHDEDSAPPPAQPGVIRGAGLPNFPGQATIGWGDTSMGPKVTVDVGGGTTLWIPPTRNVSIAALLPEETNRFSSASGRDGLPQLASPNRIIQAQGGEFFHMLFGVSAQPSCCEAGIRGASMTVRRDVPAASSNTFIPFPAAATHVTAYDGPVTAGAASPAMMYRFVILEAGGVVRPLADFTQGIEQALPRGAGTAVQVFGDAALLGRTCLVFRLEF